MGDLDVSDKIGIWGQTELSFNTRDAIIYALGIGCAEPKFVYENAPGFSVFPTMAFALLFKGTSQDVQRFPPPSLTSLPSISLPGAKVGLDGERYLQKFGELSPKGNTLIVRSRVIGAHKRGPRGALVETESEISDKETGKLIYRIFTGSFVVGAQGFKDCGKSMSTNVQLPNRTPDRVVTQQVPQNQAVVYRLSGDYNPLHIDNNFAKKAGFEVPILHGLCTLGFTVRAVLKEFGNNDTNNLKAVKTRFSSPVLPGETLEIRMWVMDEPKGRVIVQTLVKETGRAVLMHAFVELCEIFPFVSSAL